ncbi:DUF86 domain-containing protein [Cyanobacterium sp. IPPAS B-1200]|uniref:HepT-like ribonuclease domain-containing protein n=1 Tax=Cyanobacterium sp. IPPAS B-1200 TaxID=1562720 RepID=UPI00085276BB|nr:DUF86 domain-containing protein [Cyanobacterium sp. IPPAS B-1200]OEJ77911.1 hypothetical protein A5482_14630 [Cyanobacterium sp. IPPAS B-1200]
MKRELKDYILDILNAINSVEMFTKEYDFDSFCEDDKTKFAVIYAIQIIGEASNKISIDLQNKYPQIPWKDVRGMRNLIVHEYFGVNLLVIWNTINNDLPSLKPIIEDMLEDLTTY